MLEKDNLMALRPIVSTRLNNCYKFQAFNAAASKKAQELKEKGNDYLKYNELDNAINCYKQAISISPEYTDAYFNLGKAYILKEEYQNAVKALEKAAQLSPKDTEILTTLGESYKNNGQYLNAVNIFETALKLDPYSDYTKRNLEETKNLQLAVFNLAQAQKEKQAQAQQNLTKAINIAKNQFSKDFTKSLSDLTIAFDTTDKMGGRSNIAQYEHAKRKITVTEDFVWANPNLVGAYLVHEFIHAKDNDAYTSVTEEQDAYEVSAKFWLKFKKTTKPPVDDPEMDYVIDLYKKSPESLRQRVAEIYRLRDPNISETSPNHPPSTSHAAATLSQSANANPLKHYNVIA